MYRETEWNQDQITLMEKKLGRMHGNCTKRCWLMVSMVMLENIELRCKYTYLDNLFLNNIKSVIPVIKLHIIIFKICNTKICNNSTKNIILTTGIIYFVRKTGTVRIPNINNGLYYLCIPQIHVLKITSLRQRLDPRYSPNLIQSTGADPEGGAPGQKFSHLPPLGAIF